jgi:hypothetical protein
MGLDRAPDPAGQARRASARGGCAGGDERGSPLPEAAPIADYICFHKRHADGIYVDGVRQEAPASG